MTAQSKVYEIEMLFKEEYEKLDLQYENGEISECEYMTYRSMVTEFVDSLEKMWTYLSE